MKPLHKLMVTSAKLRQLIPFGLLILLLCRTSAQTPTRGADAVFLLTAGKVEFQRQGAGAWVAAERGRTLFIGDKVRTGPDSKAAIRFSDLTVLRLRESTELVIAPPETSSEKFGISLESGSTYMKSSSKPREIFLRTRSASGAIRGTEFVFSVDEAGRTLLTLLEGEVELGNEQGSVALQAGEQGVAVPGAPPIKQAVINTMNIIQWTLYYPGVLDPAELHLSEQETQALKESLAAYSDGDLLQALALYPEDRKPASDAEKIYRAALLLAVGEVEDTEKLLEALESPSPSSRALRGLIAAVKFQQWPGPPPGSSVSERMADSYYQQSRSQLEAALESARVAASLAPEFGFAWTRMAELEFSFGHTKEAIRAVDRGLALAPRHAEALSLKGFLLSAQNQFDAAKDYFERAIATDASLANGWLGRGLVRIRLGDAAGGLQDLQVAGALAPNRALLRSYLAKAFYSVGDEKRAARELQRAKELDPKDPTPWLYEALVDQQENRLNQAVRDLERSRDLNDNRGVYRSRFLLDKDRAVRRANLAQIYQDLGMVDVSAREAARAVQSDYGNYSAHLFLANSFDLLRDPNQINLRYETPWLSEYLVANLLAPAGAGALSSVISQQEYSGLFEGRRLGLVSSTEYLSRGAWQESASQYGRLDNSSYALEGYYRSDPGQRHNQDLRFLTVSALFKQQVSAQDTLYLQAAYSNRRGGDLTSYYDPSDASRGLRFKEVQEPLVVAGWHREWSPGWHTLLLLGRLPGTLFTENPEQPVVLGTRGADNSFIPAAVINAALDYRGDLEIYTAEAQQIWQQSHHNMILGLRYQDGRFDTRARFTDPSALDFLFPGGVLSDQEFNEDFHRFSAYAYENLRLVEPLLLTVGISYDQLHYPENFRRVPITPGQDSHHRLSPKAGLFWTPAKNTTVRGVYTRSLGGVSFDQSFQLEPTQIGGFNQSFRSLIPEAIAGATAAPTFETWGVGLDQRFSTGTYLGVEAQLLRSDVEQSVGVYEIGFAPPGATVVGVRERLHYQEQALGANAHQLLGDLWAVGGRYRVSKVELRNSFEQAAVERTEDKATLHQLDLFLLFHHPSGWFARGDALWYSQNNGGASSGLADEDFWQFNAWVGFRFARRRAELRVGLLNITDQNYRLNALNLYNELPRERTLAANLRFNF